MHVKLAFFELTDCALVSVAQFCDHGYSVIFNKSKVFVLHLTEIKLMSEREQPNGMWCINLKPPISLYPPTSNVNIVPSHLTNTFNYAHNITNIKMLFSFIIVVASHHSSQHENGLYKKVFHLLAWTDMCFDR